MQLFGTLRLLMSSLESSWRILAHSNPKTDPKTDPEMDPKWTQNWIQICYIVGPLFEQFWDHFGGPFGNQKIYRRFLPGPVLGTSALLY